MRRELFSKLCICSGIKRSLNVEGEGLLTGLLFSNIFTKSLPGCHSFRLYRVSVLWCNRMRLLFDCFSRFVGDIQFVLMPQINTNLWSSKGIEIVLAEE